MVGVDSNKVMRLLIIAGGDLLLSQEYRKERRKRRQWVHPWIRKRDSKAAYHLIINGLKKICIMNKVKLVWLYSLYRNCFLEQKRDLYMYSKNIFRILNNSVYFQNISVCNELLIDSVSKYCIRANQKTSRPSVLTEFLERIIFLKEWFFKSTSNYWLNNFELLYKICLWSCFHVVFRKYHRKISSSRGTGFFCAKQKLNIR